MTLNANTPLKHLNFFYLAELHLDTSNVDSSLLLRLHGETNQTPRPRIDCKREQMHRQTVSALDFLRTLLKP